MNFAIVECLEGSEREDELVASQMQMALEAGQLDRVANFLGFPAGTVEVQEERTMNDEDTINENPATDDAVASHEDENDDDDHFLDLLNEEDST